MSTFVQFTPSTQSAFSFQATLNGTPYTITVTWNLFGQRYYINVTDLSGNLILCRAMSSSGPVLQASFAWANGSALVTTQGAHNVPVGGVVNIVAQQTGSTFDGAVLALSTGATTLSYPLALEPTGALPVTGAVSFALNLVQGYGLGSLVYHFDTQQFEIG